MAKYYKQGVYSPIHPEKFIYHQNKQNKNILKLPIYRSSYELQFFKYCDYNQNIKYWSTEPFSIKYYNPIKNKICNYYVDFWMLLGDTKYLVEIKPYSQTIEPKTTYDALTYKINKSKWQAANKFCQENNMKFIILTEKQLF